MRYTSIAPSRVIEREKQMGQKLAFIIQQELKKIGALDGDLGSAGRRKSGLRKITVYLSPYHKTAQILGQLEALSQATRLKIGIEEHAKSDTLIYIENKRSPLGNIALLINRYGDIAKEIYNAGSPAKDTPPDISPCNDREDGFALFRISNEHMGTEDDYRGIEISAKLVDRKEVMFVKDKNIKALVRKGHKENLDEVFAYRFPPYIVLAVVDGISLVEIGPEVMSWEKKVTRMEAFRDVIKDNSAYLEEALENPTAYIKCLIQDLKTRIEAMEHIVEWEEEGGVPAAIVLAIINQEKEKGQLYWMSDGTAILRRYGCAYSLIIKRGKSSVEDAFIAKKLRHNSRVIIPFKSEDILNLEGVPPVEFSIHKGDTLYLTSDGIASLWDELYKDSKQMNNQSLIVLLDKIMDIKGRIKLSDRTGDERESLSGQVKEIDDISILKYTKG